MRIVRLTLAGFDLDVQENFYGRRLGLPVRRDGASTLEVGLRDAVVRFERSGLETEARHHFAINIPANAIEPAAAWVSKWGEVLGLHGDPNHADGTTIVRRDDGAAALYFLDADGNVVELIASPYIKSAAGDAGGPFPPSSLLGIAEIGIATDDLAATRAAVEGAFGATTLWGGTPAYPLTAIGDNRAVVLIAPTGRGWIPIGMPARPLPTEIVAGGGENRDLVLPEGPYRLSLRVG